MIWKVVFDLFIWNILLLIFIMNEIFIGVSVFLSDYGYFIILRFKLKLYELF